MSDYWARHRPPAPPVRRSRPPRPAQFHAQLPGFSPTPLIPLPALAARLGVGRILLKHESDRFGLPSFKPLGATWAVYRLIHSLAGLPLPDQAISLPELRALADSVGGMTLISATDGNHGRAVAFAARMVNFKAHIVVPAGTAASRIRAIAEEGAIVEELNGDYDSAVAAVAAMADDTHIVVSDTSWPGYVDIPAWITEGYTTLFDEIDAAMDGRAPDAIFVPVGVGALAHAAIEHYARVATSADAAHVSRVVCVEPTTAACVLRSLQSGARTATPGPHASMMVGLNCGTPSLLAWPVMREGLAAAVAVDDGYATQAMRELAELGHLVGETGAATTAALLAVSSGQFPSLLTDLDLGPTSTIVALATETVTDPTNYQHIVKGEGR